MGTDGAWCSISGYHYSAGTRQRVSFTPFPYSKAGLPTDLGPNVVEGGRADNRETDQEDIGLRIRKRAQAIVILLTGGIPKTKRDGLAVDHDTRRVVVKASPVSLHPRNGCGGYLHLHRGNVLAREGVRGVRDEQAGLVSS